MRYGVGFVIVATILALLIQASATPTNSKLQKFEAMAIPLERAMGYAKTARMCQLRSEQWLNNILLGEGMYINRQADVYNLSDDERDKFESDMKPYSSGRFPMRDVCAKLLNSATMDRLDKIEDLLTGGYH